MTKYFAALAASASLLTISVPIMAQDVVQDDRYSTVEQYGEQSDVTWAGTYTDLNGQPVNAEYEGTLVGEDLFITQDGRALYLDGEYGWHEASYIDESAAVSGHSYSDAERQEWLSQCRAVRAPYEQVGNNRGNRGLLGGLIGAVIGGVAGNRLADGNRLGGTLVGGGLGGLAGAVIGSAVDGDDDPNANAEYPFDYCEAYLLNYERGYGVPDQMVMVPANQARYAQAQPQRSSNPNLARISRVVEREIVVDGDLEPIATPAAPTISPADVVGTSD